ncbi:MAG: hypothetical protein M0Z94_06015 [Dehalococcoidales bacterium]|nr:hypothetical protein [Dehalococcoidales bacterium]
MRAYEHEHVTLAQRQATENSPGEAGPIPSLGMGDPRLWQAAIATCAQGLILIDAQGRLVYMNEAAQGMVAGACEPQPPRQGEVLRLTLQYPDGRPMSPEEAPLAKALQGETTARPTRASPPTPSATSRATSPAPSPCSTT